MRTKSLAMLSLSLLLLGGSAAEAVVYTMSNSPAGNEVLAFEVLPSGNLSQIGSFPTGGVGTGGSLGNQGGVVADPTDRWLFAVNAGDGTISSFRILEHGLELVDRDPSGGFRPVSITVFGLYVYVVNAGNPDDVADNDTIMGFRLEEGGTLEPIEGSSRPLSAPDTAPAQIGFNKEGTVLLVTEKATQTLTTFVLQPDGTTTGPITRSSARPTPFGFAFGDRDYVFITEANPGGRGVVASYRVDRETGELSDLVDLLEAGAATCWTVLSSDQTIGYATNTGSGTVSLYRVNFNGTIDPYFANPDRQITTGPGPLDAILTQDNQFFYTLNSGGAPGQPDEIRAFFVNRNGNIARRGVTQVPDGANGLFAR